MDGKADKAQKNGECIPLPRGVEARKKIGEAQKPDCCGREEEQATENTYYRESSKYICHIFTVPFPGI